MKVLFAGIVSAILLIVGVMVGFIATHQQTYVLRARHRCTESELFFNSKSPTFFKAGDSLLSAGKFLCDTR